MLATVFSLLLAGAPATTPLSADLLVTNKPGILFFRWQHGEKAELPNVGTARRGEPLAAVAWFAGCAADSKGECNTTMDLVILDPAGIRYGESKGLELWVGKPAPASGKQQLGVGYLMVVIEPDDPPGRYLVKAHIVDHVSKVSVDREQAFVVPPLKPSDGPAWPADRPRPDLVGFWKDHCDEDFGLKIAKAGEGRYSVSFCGPGGCFEPGTYRPHTAILGDPDYRVIDADTLEVLGDDGFTTYYRCAAAPQE